MDLERDALLALFHSYALPKGRRGANTATTITSLDVEMKSTDGQSKNKFENGNKRQRYQLIAAPSVETVTSACKRIRLVNNNNSNTKIDESRRTNLQKRQCDIDMVIYNF